MTAGHPAGPVYWTTKPGVTCTVSSTPCASISGRIYFRRKEHRSEWVARDRKWAKSVRNVLIPSYNICTLSNRLRHQSITITLSKFIHCKIKCKISIELFYFSRMDRIRILDIELELACTQGLSGGLLWHPNILKYIPPQEPSLQARSSLMPRIREYINY